MPTETQPVNPNTVSKADAVSLELMAETGAARRNKKGKRIVAALNVLDDLVYEGIVDNQGDREAAKEAVFTRLEQYVSDFKV